MRVVVPITAALPIGAAVATGVTVVTGVTSITGTIGAAVAIGVAGLAVTTPATAQLRDEFGGDTLRGAGSSFAQPLLARWVQDYQAWRTGGVHLPAAAGHSRTPAVAGSGLDGDAGGPALDYEPVGSQAGIERLKTGAVDFAVSELPLSAEELKTHRLLQVPVVTGAVAVTYHLAGKGANER